MILISIHIAQSRFIQVFSPLFTHTQLHKTAGEREKYSYLQVPPWSRRVVVVEHVVIKEWFMALFSRNGLLGYFVIR